MAAFVVVAGLALVSSPWWVRMARDLTAERSARIREQERAEVAAHVHDSVLQTLTLIQRHVDDPREVTRLARAQERELRGWLYRRRADPDQDLAAGARAGRRRGRGRARRRDRGRGRRRLPDGRAARGAARAAREALVNAAKYAGGAPVSLYAEVEPDAGHRVRARPRPGVRPGRRARGPARPAPVGPWAGWTATAGPRWSGRHPATAPRCSWRCRRDTPAGARHDRRHTAAPARGRAVRVVLVDDHRMFRSGRARRARRRRRGRR